MKPLNFRNSKDAADLINSKMSQDTNDYITDIVDPKKLNEKTTLVLVDAVHFKGYWEHPFDVYKTKSMTFSSGQDVYVETKGMQLTAKLKYKEIKGACVFTYFICIFFILQYYTTFWEGANSDFFFREYK